MKIELTANLYDAIVECANIIDERCANNDIDVHVHCDLCPLVNACLQVLTGDDTENKY